MFNYTFNQFSIKLATFLKNWSINGHCEFVFYKKVKYAGDNVKESEAITFNYVLFIISIFCIIWRIVKLKTFLRVDLYVF